MKKNVFLCYAVLIVILASSVPATAKQGACPTGSIKSPDLVVTSIKVDKSDNNNVKVIYTVKNQGNVVSKTSNTSIQLVSKKDKKDIMASTNTTPSLDPGKSYTTMISYPVKSKGDFVINATADYNKKISESNETNNFNSIGFSIGIKLGK